MILNAYEAHEQNQWRAYAACLDADVDLFFPENMAVLDYGPALAICADCVVTVECLDSELTANPRPANQVGVFGGLTPEQRKQMLTTRGAA